MIPLDRVDLGIREDGGLFWNGETVPFDALAPCLVLVAQVMTQALQRGFSTSAL